MWDEKWLSRLAKVKIVIALAMRYMDDGRAFLAPIKAGWRWVEGDLVFCRRWEKEDQDMSPTERTKKILHATMSNLEDFLNFTMETENEFPNGWLPTLDTELKMMADNRVEYRFFEKPMSSNMGVQRLSAMEKNAKIQTLSNDLTRRLLNTSETLGIKERIMVVNQYSQKLVNSGFKIEQTRRIVINGIQGYEKRVKESKRTGGRKLHRKAEESSGGRMRKKTSQ